MLFRRVLQHFRKQEWTAVAIDLVIVVVGVYIGIQAQAWNTDRENRQIERQYLQNLYDEVSAMIERDAARVITMQETNADLVEATEILDGKRRDTELNDDHCDAFAVSHIYVGRIYVPPTIEELLTTGRLQLIRNSELRSEMVAFSQAVEGYRQLIADIQGDRVTLAREFPALIELTYSDDEGIKCNFTAMQQSAAFRNFVSDNRSRFRAYVEAVVVDQQELRVALQSLLADELGISEPGSVPSGDGS